MKKGVITTELSLQIPYSSTCPCSAALARQLIQKGFQQQFSESGMVDAEQVHDWVGNNGRH